MIEALGIHKEKKYFRFGRSKLWSIQWLWIEKPTVLEICHVSPLVNGELIGQVQVEGGEGADWTSALQSQWAPISALAKRVNTALNSTKIYFAAQPDQDALLESHVSYMYTESEQLVGQNFKYILVVILNKFCRDFF